MTEQRPATEFWLMAQIRQCQNDNIPAYIMRRGDKERGTVLLKLNRIETGCEIWIQARDSNGVLGWLQALKGALVEEAEANTYIERSIKNDPDLWVVEIEDRTGPNPFPGPRLK